MILVWLGLPANTKPGKCGKGLPSLIELMY